MDNQNDPNNIPTLADIVRRETNNGALIVGFYLDVVEGNRDEDGFEACHRMEAAQQLEAVAPGVVADFIEENAGIECIHAQRRTASGLVQDRYGKYIFQYCPYSPTPIREQSRPRRQSRPTPATESIRQEMTADRLRREGKLPPPKRTLLWV